MKRTFYKQINVVYIQFNIERIILAIKHAKKKIKITHEINNHKAL